MEEIEKIINEHIDSGKYITSLEEIYVLFEKYNLLMSERNVLLKKIDEFNQKLYKLEQVKERKFQQIKSGNIKLSNNLKEHSPLIKQVQYESDKQVINIDVSSYLKKINAGNETLEEILPNKSTEDYTHILNSILIELYKQKVDITNILFSQESEDDMKELFLLEVDRINKLIDKIIEERDFIEVETIGLDDNSKLNQLIFLKSTTGKPYILSNLKGMEEYYDSFKELLDSIINGTFKKIKIFQNNDKYMKLMEVRGYKTRIIFSRIADNTYVIIDAFVKKCDTDLRHRTILEKDSNLFQCQKNSIINMLEDKKALQQENQFTEELIKILDGNKRKVL